MVLNRSPDTDSQESRSPLYKALQYQGQPCY